MNTHLARRGDPETSHLAADSLVHDLSVKHQSIIDWLCAFGPATDLEMAEAMVRTGVYQREEAARRAVRTIREEHGLMVLAVDDTGKVIRHTNSTGRDADCWRFGKTEPRRPGPQSIEARVRSCREVERDYVEHVRFNGWDYYLAADLLEALMEGPV